MRLLIDNCLSPRLLAEFVAAGHDVVHVRDQGLHRMVDSEILVKAARENRVLVTADYDFADIIALLGARRVSAVIVDERVIGPRTTLGRRILDALTATASQLELGAIVMLEPGRHRVRALPIDPPRSSES